jgi:hypothetical protein
MRPVLRIINVIILPRTRFPDLIIIIADLKVKFAQLDLSHAAAVPKRISASEPPVDTLTRCTGEINFDECRDDCE